MIITETVEIDEVQFTRTYSDSNLMIKKVGTEEIYNEAYDVQHFTYEETDIIIPVEEIK